MLQKVQPAAAEPSNSSALTYSLKNSLPTGKVRVIEEHSLHKVC